MAEKTQTIKVVIDASNATRALEVLRGNFKATAEVVKDTGKTVDNTMKDIEKSVKGVDNSLGFLKNAFKAAFVLDAITSFGHQLYEVNSKFQSFVATMTVVTGSVQQSKQEFEYLTSIANKYGVSIQSLTSTYSKLAAAGKDSALTHQDLHKIFEAMAMASNVLHLSVEETRLVFYALQQMVSKGNVTMEELRRQLAEKFPGAVNLMGQALEVPVKELERLIKTGQVAADQALPKFADMIMKAFGPASQYAINSLNAVVTRLSNAWFTFMQKMAETSGLIPIITEAIDWLTKALNDNGGAAKAIGDELTKVVKIVVDWVKGLTAEDIRTFFKSVSDIIGAVVPLLKLAGMIIQGWSLILSPVIKEMTTFFNLLSEGKWKEGFLMFANLGKHFVPGPIRAALEELETGMKRWHAATEPAAASGNRVVGVIKRLSEEKINYGKSTTDQIKDLEIEYQQSLKSIMAKTKLRDATSELIVLERERSNLFKIATDTTKSDQERIDAYRKLIASEKDYVSLKKESIQEIKQSEEAHKKALEPALRYLESLTKEADALELSTDELQKKNRETALAGLKGQEYVDMLNKIIAAETRLNAARSLDKWKKDAEDRSKAIQRDLDDLDKAIKAQEKHNATIGLGKNGLREYEIAQLESAAASVEMTLATIDNYDISEQEYELLVKKLAKLRELIQLKKTGDALDDALEATIKAQEASLKLWKSLDDYTDKFFQDLIINGKSAFDALIADLKKFAAELLSLAARKFIFNIVGNLIGGNTGNAMLNTAANAGTNTLAGTALNAGMSWAGNTALGSAVTGGWSSFMSGWTSVTMAGEAGAPVLAGTVAADGFMATLGATLAEGYQALLVALEAIPIWGWIAAAVIAVGVWLSGRGGGPKVGGSFMGSYDAGGSFLGAAGVSNPTENGQLLSETQANSQLGPSVNSWARNFASIQRRFGGSMGFNAGLAFNNDPQGDAPSMVRGQLQMGGRTVFDYQNSNVDDKQVAKEMALVMKRMIVAGLQNSDLPDALSSIFNSIDATTATEEQIDALMKYAEAFQNLIDITGEFTDAQLESIELAGASQWEQYQAQGDALEDLANSFDGSLDSINALTVATEEYRKSQVQLLIEIQKISKELQGMFSSSRRTIEMAGLTNEQRYNYIQTETEGLVDQLEVAVDPAEIQRLSRLINQNILDAFSLLTPEQQAIMRQTFLNRIDYIEGLTGERLGIARDTILGDNSDDENSPLNTVVRKLNDFATSIKPAADKIEAAANTMTTAAGTQLTAANTPVQVTIYLDYNNQDNGKSAVMNGG